MEYWVITFLANSELTIWLVRLLVVLGGFVVGLALHLESTTKLERGPYMFLFGVISLLLVVPGAMWLLESHMFLNHILWVIQLGEFGALVLFGYLFAVFSVWRARDAFGITGFAFVAVVPVVQALLFIKDSNTTIAGEQSPVFDLFGGWGGPIMGALLLGLTGFLYIWVDEHYVPDAGVTRAVTFARIQNYGLEGTLAMMASETRTPVEYGDFSTLVAVEARDRAITYRYATEYESTVYLTEQYRSQLLRHYCREMPFNVLVTQGASFEQAYLSRDGSVRESYVIDREQCEG